MPTTRTPLLTSLLVPAPPHAPPHDTSYIILLVPESAFSRPHKNNNNCKQKTKCFFKSKQTPDVSAPSPPPFLALCSRDRIGWGDRPDGGRVGTMARVYQGHVAKAHRRAFFRGAYVALREGRMLCRGDLAFALSGFDETFDKVCSMLGSEVYIRDGTSAGSRESFKRKRIHPLPC